MEERIRTLERDVALNKQEINTVEKNSKNWWATMREDVEDIKNKIDKLPDEIINRLKENTDLKIKTCVQELRIEIETEQKKTYKWITGLTIGMIVSLIGVLFGLFLNFINVR